MSDSAPSPAGESGTNASLSSLLFVYLKLGLTAFGGPAVHVALMEEEVVHRRKWVTHESFLDMLGVTNLIPGPNSTEMAMHVGLRRAGLAGLLLTGAAFILPAAIIVTVFGWLYVKFGRVPEVQPFIEGVQPAVVAVLAGAVWRLGRSAAKTRALVLLAIAAAIALLAGLNEIAVLFSGGVLGMLWARRNDLRGGLKTSITLGGASLLTTRRALAVAVGAGAATAAAPSLPAIFFYFLKIGSVMYGSGYVLIAFLQGGLVERYEWISQQQLFDAIAVGQVTPGPVSTAATFIGFLLGGVPGAIAGTVGIFLPAFVFVFLIQPAVPWLRARRWPASFLDAINATAIGLMGGVTVEFARESMLNPRGAAIGIIAALALIKFRINSAWIIIGAALANGLLALAMK